MEESDWLKGSKTTILLQAIEEQSQQSCPLHMQKYVGYGRNGVEHMHTP
jgi:hypothetical protein